MGQKSRQMIIDSNENTNDSRYYDCYKMKNRNIEGVMTNDTRLEHSLSLSIIPAKGRRESISFLFIFFLFFHFPSMPLSHKFKLSFGKNLFVFFILQHLFIQ